jgi:hypothetical protein
MATTNMQALSVQEDSSSGVRQEISMHDILEKIDTAAKIQLYLATQCLGVEDNSKCNVLVNDIKKLADYIHKLCSSQLVDISVCSTQFDEKFENSDGQQPTRANPPSPKASSLNHAQTPDRPRAQKFDRLVEKMLSPPSGAKVATQPSENDIMSNIETAEIDKPTLPKPICLSPIPSMNRHDDIDREQFGSTDSIFQNLIGEHGIDDNRIDQILASGEFHFDTDNIYAVSSPESSARTPGSKSDGIDSPQLTTKPPTISSAEAAPTVKAEKHSSPPIWLQQGPGASPSGWKARRPSNESTPPNKMNLRQVKRTTTVLVGQISTIVVNIFSHGILPSRVPTLPSKILMFLPAGNLRVWPQASVSIIAN